MSLVGYIIGLLLGMNLVVAGRLISDAAYQYKRKSRRK